MTIRFSTWRKSDEAYFQEIIKRFEESGLRNSKNWAKIVEKQNRAMKGMDDAVKRQKEIEADTWKIISQAARQNYQVISTPQMRDTIRRGEQWAGMLGGAIGGGAQAAVNMYRYGGPEHLSAETNKWKVLG